MKKRLIIGMSGASGVPITVEILKELQKHEDWESLLVVTDGAKRTIEMETDLSVDELLAMATTVYDIKDIGASIASGTFVTEGMVVVPCSMKTVGGIHSGYSDNLLLRAADVTLKEHRKLVLVARETPFSSIHLRNLSDLSQMGAIILPPMLTYYHKPDCLEDMTSHIAAKVLDVFGIEHSAFRRWS